MNAPAITTQGPPPERHAARLVGEMCRWLAVEQPRLVARHRQLLKGSFAKLGNPKAQRRFTARMLRDPELGQRFLAFWLVPGKRGHCTFRWLTWAPVTPGGEPIMEGDPIPTAPWLVCLLEEVRLKDREGSGVAPVVTLTHHAMQRLAERCGARTTNDLLVALGEIACGVIAAGEEEAKTGTFAKTLRIPVAGGVAIAEESDEHGLLVKTVLDAAWVDTPE